MRRPALVALTLVLTSLWGLVAPARAASIVYGLESYPDEGGVVVRDLSNEGAQQ